MRTTDLQFKAGVRWRRAHALPHFVRILDVALECAPETEDGALWVTELWRPPRHASDLHTLCLAADFRIHNFVVPSGLTYDKAYAARRERAWGFVNWMRDELNDRRYQFDVHGDGPNIHLHAEYDPRG